MRSRIIKRAILYFLLGLVGLVLFTLAFINLPFTHRFVTRQVNNIFVSTKLPIHLNSVKRVLPYSAVIEGVYIYGIEGDTIIHVENLRATIKILSLLKREVIIPSAYLESSSVRFSRENADGKINIADTFTWNREKKDKNGEKSWEVSVGSVGISDLKFLMSDPASGIYIDQEIGSLKLKTKRMSIREKAILVKDLEMEGASGSIRTSPKPRAKKNGGSGKWEFGLANLSLGDINFLFDDTAQRKMLQLSIEDAMARTRKSDIKNKILDFSRISLEGVSTILKLDQDAVKPKDADSEIPGSFPWDIDCEKLVFGNVSFLLGSYAGGKAGGDEAGFGIDNLDLRLSDIRLNSQLATAGLKRAEFDLNNGFSVKKLEGKLDSREGLTLLDLNLETGNSQAIIEARTGEPFFDLITGPGSIADAGVSLGKTRISLRDFEYFKPGFLDRPIASSFASKPLSLDGSMMLRDSVLSLSTLTISQSPGFSFSLDGAIHDSLQFELYDIKRSWLLALLEGLGSEYELPDFTFLTVAGCLSDSLFAPGIKLELESDLGYIDLKGAFDFKRDRFSISSHFDRLRLDSLLDNPGLGAFTGSGEISGSGMNRKALTADANLSIDSLGYKGYTYTRGEIVAKLGPEVYDVRCIVDDPALGLDLTAGIDSRDSVLKISTSATFRAQINELQRQEDSLELAGSLDASLRKGAGVLEADLRIPGLSFTSPRDQISTDELITSLSSDTSGTNLTARAGFYDMDIHVEKPLGSLSTIITDYSLYASSFLDSLSLNRSFRNAHLPGMQANLNIKYNRTLDYLIEDLQFENIELAFVNEPSEKRLELSMLSRKLKYKMLELKDLNTRITDSRGAIEVELVADSNTIFSHPGNRLFLSSQFADERGSTRISLSDTTNAVVYEMEISSEADSARLYLTVPSKQMTLNRVLWQMDSEELLSYNFAAKRISPDLKIHTGNSFLQLFAEGNESRDIITCTLGNLNLGSLIPENIITGDPAGRMSGSVSYLTDGKESRELSSDLVFSNLRWSGLNFSDLSLEGQFNSEKPGDWTLHAFSRLDTAEIEIYSGRKEGRRMAFNAELQSFPISTVQPFVKEHISKLGGYVSGQLNISAAGQIEDSFGEIAIRKGNLRINTLNSEYRIPEDKIYLKGNKFSLDKFTILDSLDNELLINGFVEFSQPEGINTDLEISSSNLQVMNRKDNSSFFGQVFVDSRVLVKGPLPTPDLTGRILLTHGTELFFSKEEDLSLTESDKVITFVSATVEEDKEDFSLVEKQPVFNNSTIETLVEIDPDTRIHFKLSQKMYLIDLMIQGGAALNYGMLENKQMSLTGRYDIGEGEANVKMTGWPNKLFRITPGGYMGWDGNIEDPTLKIEVSNQVSSSYTNPVDGKIRNVDVNVILQLANRLSELDLLFTINTPDQYLMSIINTLSPEEKMRQAITILLFEKIDLPGISTSTDYVTQQVNAILSNQLNELTKSTIKGVDISFGIDTYTSATSSGGEQTNTSLSYDIQKAMLNDRGKIEISGRVNDYSNPQSSSNISLNNVSFEYQLDSAATKYVKVYNEQTYEDVFEGEVIKTGMGFIYRKSYPTFSDIWKRKEKKNKEKGE